MSRALSPVQRTILLYLHDAYELAARVGGIYEARFLVWGAPWRPSRLFDRGRPWQRSDSVIVAKALAGLERRGLVLRNNQRTGCEGPPIQAPDGSVGTFYARKSLAMKPPARTTHVLLTAAGRTRAAAVTANIFHAQNVSP